MVVWILHCDQKIRFMKNIMKSCRYNTPRARDTLEPHLTREYPSNRQSLP